MPVDQGPVVAPEVAQTKQHRKDLDEIAAEFNLPKVQKDIPCPNCYGGHFRPCQWCGDTGRVDFVPNDGTQP